MKLINCKICGKRPTLQYNSWYDPPFWYRCKNDHYVGTRGFCKGVVTSFLTRAEARREWNNANARIDNESQNV